MNKKITVLGGDTRQVYTARCLARKGYDVKVFGFELFGEKIGLPFAQELTEAMRADAVILPLPCTKNGKTLFAPFANGEYDWNELFPLALPGTFFFAGKAPASLESRAKAFGCTALDYFTREELTLKNALLTGEGVLSVLLDRLPVTVFGAEIGITGYGRVAF